MKKLYYLLFITLLSCSTVSSVYNINQPLPNTKYTLVGQISVECNDNNYENTYDFLLNEAIDRYGDGVDVVNITKDKEGRLFSSYLYINAHVIKYESSDTFSSFDLDQTIINKSSNIQSNSSIEELSLSNEIALGSRVNVRIDGEIVIAEIIKVLDGDRYAISYKDTKGKTNKIYINKEQIVKD